MRIAVLLLVLAACLAAVEWIKRDADSAPVVAPGSTVAEASDDAPQNVPTVSREAHPGNVVDAAGVLGGFHNTLERQSAGWRDDLGIELHVVTLRAPGRAIEELANEVFESRRIGESAPTGGLLVLVNPARGEARVAVSYALEGMFPDAFVGRVAERQLAPYASYRLAGMAAMDAVHMLKDFAYLRAAGGAFDLAPEFRARPEFQEKARYLSGGGGAQASLSAAGLADRDFKARVPDEERGRYAPSADPHETADAFLRTLRDFAGDPTLDVYTPGSRCMRAAYPYAPFEQIERLHRIEASAPLEIAVSGDHAVLDSPQPAHGFVPILLERRDGLWRVDLVETWKNLFFSGAGDHHQQNANHPYGFGLERFGEARFHDISPLSLGDRDPAELSAAFASEEGIFEQFLAAEILYRNCWLPLAALVHYGQTTRISPGNRFFERRLGDRAAYIGFSDLAASAYEKLHPFAKIDLARARHDAGDIPLAIEAAQAAVDRNPFDLEALRWLHWLQEKQGLESAAALTAARIEKTRADPTRPSAPVVATFSPENPTLHIEAPTQVGETTVYDHSFFSVTLTNTSGRDVEIEAVRAFTDGTPGRSGLGDIKDYWSYPSGGHTLAAGESVRLDKTWGFTIDTPHEVVRHTFDVCWRGAGELQCADYAVDAFSR